jgi:hypothetical protein
VARLGFHIVSKGDGSESVNGVVHVTLES